MGDTLTLKYLGILGDGLAVSSRCPSAETTSLVWLFLQLLLDWLVLPEKYCFNLKYQVLFDLKKFCRHDL